MTERHRGSTTKLGGRMDLFFFQLTYCLLTTGGLRVSHSIGMAAALMYMLKSNIPKELNSNQGLHASVQLCFLFLKVSFLFWTRVGHKPKDPVAAPYSTVSTRRYTLHHLGILKKNA